MYSVSYILYLMLLVPVGLTVDRFGRRNMLLLSIAFLVMSSFIYAVAPLNTPYTLLTLIIAYSAIVLANVAYANAVGALEADYIPREKRGRVTAALAFVAALAGAAGQVLGGFEYGSINQRFPFIFLTVFMVLSFLVVLFRIKEPKMREL
jgi:MFS family permease